MSRATILLAFLAACAPSYESRAFDWPWVPQLPPPPPERAMRIAPDFSFRDEEKGKEYFIRVYSDREFEEELVTVVDRNDPAAGERLATLDEYDFAMKSFESLWEKKRLEERLRYHRELREKEVRRDATQIDSLLRLTKDVLRSLVDAKDLDLEALDPRAREHPPASPVADRPGGFALHR